MYVVLVYAMYLCTLNDELYSTSKFVYLVDIDQPYILSFKYVHFAQICQLHFF